MKRKTESIRMKRLCGIFLILPLLFGACSREESTNEFPQGNIPISFSGDVPVTRSAKKYTTAGDLENIGVFAYFTHGNFNEGIATPNFMYNQLVAKQPDDTWSYSPVKFWPDNSTTDKISFFAYAPYMNKAESSNISFLGKETATGFPVLSYTVPKAENDQIDFLVASPVMDRNNGNVSFRLHHALTKVTFRVKSGGKYAKEITSLTINAATTGQLQSKEDGFLWEDVSGNYGYKPAAGNLTFDVTTAEKEIATFYLLPTETVAATYDITYKVKTTSGSEVFTKTITAAALPATPLWEAGTNVVYTLNLSDETVIVTAGVIEDWITEAPVENTIISVEEYTVNDLKIGDYYYSDGTTSDGGLRQSVIGKDAVTGEQTADMMRNDFYDFEPKSPVADKTCIGIVFYVGQGEGDDVANYDKSFGMTQIDGYVVALQHAAIEVRWGPLENVAGIPQTDYKKDFAFNGYTNTEIVKALNDADYVAFAKAVEYEETTVRKDGIKASTWYMPSTAQLRSVYSSHGGGFYETDGIRHPYREEIVYTNIRNAGGVNIPPGRCWSSSQKNDTEAHYIQFQTGNMAGHRQTKDINNNVRCILTFQKVTD
ncbi:fimbrillin family protein [Bacteroides fragilis]|uniref:fimbrillin family protein n=1 Tax=Bacteroides fragilis TaxID=817 RepID=UPI002030D4B3|nr:fimbrillin family protein [Bacteroides fragilis]MCM0340536.1 fimbrillin family protein [Bacteroides fragilis]